jgi:hypothetical protein
MAEYLKHWSKNDTHWEDWNEVALVEARDRIRVIVESDESPIGKKSSADNVILNLVPTHLAQTGLTFYIVCGNCHQNFMYPAKYPVLMFDGFAQENSDTQRLIDRMVDLQFDKIDAW